MRIHKVISNLQPQFLQIGKYRVLKLHSASKLTLSKNMSFDAIIVDKESLISEVLRNDNHYLKPLFITSKTKRQCDGLVHDSDVYSISNKIDVLKSSISELEDLPLPSEPGERLLTKMLRYLVSRKESLIPLNTRKVSIGYAYALVEDMSIESNGLHILEHLNQFVKKDYLKSTIIDKINICYECHGSYLNFSECCTKCNSIDLKSEELIHHFRCAYVGPQSDFLKQDKLICPKCDHQLKHIGIDYDKPSEIHTCKSCNHSSQETKMKARCTDCSKENELEQLVTHNIYAYGLTEKGRSKAYAVEGSGTFEDTELGDQSLLTNVGVFELILSHESKRWHDGNNQVFQLLINLSDTILNNLNKGMQISLLSELAQIIHPYLKPNDLISIDQRKNIQILLLDYSDSLSSQLVDVLHYNLNKMLLENGWSESNVVQITSKKIGS